MSGAPVRVSRGSLPVGRGTVVAGGCGRSSASAVSPVAAGSAAAAALSCHCASLTQPNDAMPTAACAPTVSAATVSSPAVVWAASVPTTAAYAPASSTTSPAVRTAAEGLRRNNSAMPEVHASLYLVRSQSPRPNTRTSFASGSPRATPRT
jgi:hypothetical protein